MVHVQQNQGNNTNFFKGEPSLTMMDDAVLQESLTQVDSLLSLTDLSTLQEPWDKLTEDTQRQQLCQSAHNTMLHAW